MKRFILSAIISVIFSTSSTYAANYRGTSEALYPPGTELVQVFDGATSIGVPTDSQVNTGFLPDEGILEVVPFGPYSTFEVTIDVSIRCVAGSYYPAVSITESTSVRLKPFDATGYRCWQPNLRTLTGGGASIDAYMIPRGN